MTEDERIGWHHGLNGHEFEQTLGDGEGRGSLLICIPWGRRVGHDWMTEQQKRTQITVQDNTREDMSHDNT